MCWISAEFLVANYNRPNHNNPGHNDHIWTMPYCRSFNDSKGVPWQQGWHWTSALMPSDAGRRLTQSANLRRLWLSPLPTDLYWEHRTALAELATWLQQSALDCTWNTIKQPTIYCFTAIIQVNQRSPAPPVKNWRVLLVQSFTVCMPLLMAASAFRLRRRRWSSLQQCYLHCVRTLWNTIT